MPNEVRLPKEASAVAFASFPVDHIKVNALLILICNYMHDNI